MTETGWWFVMFHTYAIKAVTWPIAHACLVGLKTQQQKLGPYTNGLFWGTHFTCHGTPHTPPPPHKLSGLFRKISLFFFLLHWSWKRSRKLVLCNKWPQSSLVMSISSPPPSLPPSKVSLQDDVNGDPYTRNSQNSKPGEEPKLRLGSNGMEWM